MDVFNTKMFYDKPDFVLRSCCILHLSPHLHLTNMLWEDIQNLSNFNYLMSRVFLRSG